MVGWGYLPWVSLIMATGLAFTSASNILARNGSPDAMYYYWIGLVLIIVPVSIRFVSTSLGHSEAIGILLAFGVVSYVASYLRSPIVFRGFDDSLHWRTASDILYSGHLFTPNTMLPVSPLYPGLENVTTALVNMTGLSVFDASSLVLVVSRLIMMLALFFLYYQLSNSARIAGIATLVYTGSSTFMYFESQFGYESLALPLLLLGLFLMVRRTDLQPAVRWVWNIILALLLFSMVATHHMTTYAFIIILILWVCTDIVAVLLKEKSTSPFWMLVLLVIMVWVWAGAISTNTNSYLSPIINGAINSFLSLVAGQSSARVLFRDSAGEGAVLFERVIAITSVLLLGFGLLFGVWQWWLSQKRHALVMAFVLLACSYPLLPIMRLSDGAWDMAHRASGFVFIGLGLIVSLGMIQFPLPSKFMRSRQIIAVISLSVIFLGGVFAGTSPGSRVDQPYRPASGPRSIDSQTVLTADWARETLGPNHRMAADRTLSQVMGSYGMQRMVTNLNDKVSISGIFLRFKLTPSDYDVITKADIRYLVIDDRITTVLSTYGYYFESWEDGIVRYTPPVNIEVLRKFDHVPGVSRIYDSGNIVIYDIGILNENP